MKNFRTLFLAVVIAALFAPISIKAQEEETTEKESKVSWDVGADIVSGYVWRGTKIHNASLQPFLSFGFAGLEIGAWGAYEISNTSAVNAEADLYASYGFDFGLSLGITDYFYPGGEGYFEFSDTAGTHAFEINGGYEIKGFYVSANYVLNKAGWAASEGGDMYFEAGYGFKMISVFLGAGNGWHTTYEDNGDDVFAICNIGISASKEVKVTDNYSIPIFGSVSVNPDRKEFNIVAGISF